jgi:predicted enzyme related to lactoylglutathione lyase
LQGGAESVLFFVGVADVEATLARAEQLGGKTVQPAQSVPGVTFGVFADAQGHMVGVAAN